MSETNKTLHKVSRWATKNGWRVGSHIHHGLFLVSRPLPDGELGPSSRDWRVARHNTKTRANEVLESVGHPLKNGAAAVMQKMLAEKGISMTEPPTISLTGAPAFPVNVLDNP